MHETISDIFVKMDQAPGDPPGLCMPNWFIAYLGDAWGTLSERCDWWSRLQICSDPCAELGGDTDEDGICDDADRCRWRGDGVYGITYDSNNIGCPLGDADGDTIPNIYDNCPWRGDEYGLGLTQN